MDVQRNVRWDLGSSYAKGKRDSAVGEDVSQTRLNKTLQLPQGICNLKASVGSAASNLRNNFHNVT